jgi:Zn-dependent protease
MKQSLRLGTISGIPVGLNWGLLVVAFFYLTSLANGVLPRTAPGFSTASYWAVGVVGVLLFLASILAHELGHSLVAQREGIKVRAITLWLLGGVAEIEREAETPGAEFRIAGAGPAVSLALGAIFYGAGFAYDAVFGPSLLATMLTWLGVVNGILAIFNLIPAAPLDGGRILTAALWWKTHNPHRARATSARVGQGFGWLMLSLGALAFFSGGTFWLLILGWFILSGAGAERRRAQLFAVAANASVGEVMAPLASPTDSAVTIAGLIAMGGDDPQVAFPVRGAQGTLVGLVPGSALQQVHPRRSAATSAGDLTIPWSDFVSARADEGLQEVIERMQAADASHVLVYDAWDNQTGYVGTAQLTAASLAAA